MTSTQEWFSVSTFREPYRVEGKKTIGFEIAEQFGWNLPAMIIYPTGGGTGLVGMWKAFEELGELGWLENKKLPRMVAVQSEGCAPFVQAYNHGWGRCEFWQDAETIANGIRVPISLADRMIREIIHKSGGCAIGVSETAILKAQKELAEVHGIFTSPEGGATLAAYKLLLLNGEIQPDEQVVLFSTASGVKYW
jgi:threonine synthase